jgi:hypothetical protein
MGPLNADLIDLGQSLHEEMDLFLLPSEIEVHVIAGVGVATPLLITETRQRPIRTAHNRRERRGRRNGTSPQRRIGVQAGWASLPAPHKRGKTRVSAQE